LSAANKNIKIGLYGAGLQAYYQIKAISEIFNICELKIYDIKSSASEKLAEKVKNFINGNIVIVNSPKDGANMDVVICVTTSKDKFIKLSWLNPGTIFFPLGSYQECEDNVVLNIERIIVDHVGQSLHRGALRELSEKGMINKNNIHATIGEVAVGNKKGRCSKKDRILCHIVGTGAMDVSVATVVYNRAIEKNLGSNFCFV